MGPLHRLLSGWLRRFSREEAGGMAIYGLFTFVTCCAVGAIALDVTHVYAARAQLQAASDAAAHAALYTRRHDELSENEAKRRAIAILQHSLPTRTFGRVIDPSDIAFGTYDATTGVFTPRRGSADAVRVRVERAGSSGNPVATFLFRMVGVRTMDVRAETVFTAVGDPCADFQGLFAQGAIATNGLTDVSAGFCIHSNLAATFRNKVTLSEDAVVSMPDTSKVECSGSDMAKHCPGLEDALRSAHYDIASWLDPIRPPAAPAVDTKESLLADVEEALPSWKWANVDRDTIRTETSRTLTPSMANLSGRVSYIDCGAGGGSVTLGTEGNNKNFNGTYRNLVLLMRNCDVTVDKDVTLVGTVLYTTSTNAMSFKSAGGPNDSMVVGDDADCDGVGAAALLTRGGLHTASGLTLNGGTIRALRDVTFAANFGGKDGAGKGVSIVAGGMIDPKSNNAFTACDPKPGAAPTLVSFRLVR